MAGLQSAAGKLDAGVRGRLPRVCAPKGRRQGHHGRAAVGELHHAAELAEQGLPFEDLCAELQVCQKNTRLCFTLEHFDNLVNNGRMPPLAGTLLQTLGIRIVAEATAEGTIRVAKKARGEAHTARAIAQLMSDAKDCTGSHVIITHCQNPEGAERLRNAILDRLPVKAVEVLPCRGLTSFYAMDKGLILSY